MNWSDKTQVKKGDIGEQIVKDLLEKKGYSVYKAITEKAHAFDFLAIKGKQQLLFAEVKTKAKTNKWPATGIDIKHFNEYKFILEKYNIDFILFFVDEHPDQQRVYCQKLSCLIEECQIDGELYPNTTMCKGIILFPLQKMIHVRDLTDDEAKTLKQLSTRNYEYK
jgi:Holliday junction resolvase-like predicted endonuclease